VLSQGAEWRLRHPVFREEGVLVRSGTPARLELELTAGEPEKEGWETIRLRIEVIATF
jgi:hypothetical protein